MGRHWFTAAARTCVAFVACLGFVLPVGCATPTQSEPSTQSAATLAPTTLEGAYEPTDGLDNADQTAIASIAFDGAGTYYLWRNQGCNEALQDDCPAPETGSYDLTLHELTLTNATSGLTTKVPLELGLGATTSVGIVKPQDQLVQPPTSDTVTSGNSTTTGARNVNLAGRGYQLVNRKKLPKFDDMWNAYPHDDDSSLVKKQIGGAVNSDWLTNTCTVRLSAALNGSGMLLPNGPSSTTSGLHTVKGADGNNYAYRVSEMRDYLNKTVGPAPLVMTGSQITPDKIKGQKGIIAFTVKFSDATGHFDLWDGNQPAHAEYFDRASKVEFWPAE